MIKTKPTSPPPDGIPQITEKLAKRLYHLTQEPLIRRVGYGYLTPHRFRRILYPLAILVVLLGACCVAGVKVFHVEERLQKMLITEMEERGITISMRKISLDAFGGVVARDVQVYQTNRKMTTAVQVKSVRFGVNWFSWWRGEPIINHATLYGADLSIPLSKDTNLTLTNVNAQVEIKPQRLVISFAEASFSKLHLRLAGEIELPPGGMPDHPPTPEEMARRVEIYQKIRDELETLTSTLAVNVNFHVAADDPLSGSAQIQIETSDYNWRGIPIPRIFLSATYDDRIVRLDRATVAFTHGSLQAEGLVQIDDRKATLNFSSDVDPTLFKTVLDEKFRDQIASVYFSELPLTEGTCELNWGKGFSYFTRASFNWKNIFVDGKRIDSLHALVAYDGSRFIATDVAVKQGDGVLKGEVLLDGNRNVTGKISSSIDFTALRPLFGAGAQPFLKSLTFEEGPVIEAKISGHLPSKEELQPGVSPLDSILVQGNVALGPSSYRNGRGTETRIHELKTSFTWQNRILTLPDLSFKRTPDELATAQVIYDFRIRHVTIHNGQAHADVQKTVPIFGGKLETYTTPYRLNGFANVRAEGVIDLAEQTATDLSLDILAPGGMNYTFLGKDLQFPNIDAHLDFKGKNMKVVVHNTTTLFRGHPGGTIQLDLGQDGPPYTADFTFDGMELRDALVTYFNNNAAHGLTSGNIKITGKLNDISTIEGGGELQVKQGDVYQIPVLGGLSQVIGSILPVGFSKAENAKVKYSFDKGILTMKDLNLYSETFALIGEGTYDYMKDALDLRVRVNVRGLLGLPLFPFSKAFEYRGTGSLKAPKWEANVF